ncbi:MAG: TerL protein [Gammaproteobacteria bacterium]
MLSKVPWPPDFDRENDRRSILRSILANTEDPRTTVGELYVNDPVAFINDWCITYDPRNAAKVLPPKMPFLLFPKQEELVQFFLACLHKQEFGLVEKCRDMGATWVAASFSVWLWCFVPGSAVGWGSRKEALLDRLGDPSSIFQKMRMIIDELPGYILPEGFNPQTHNHFMKITGPHGSTITGESGDSIGRGGRTSLYFLDEAAHLERPELVEASLGDNTSCRIDLSSVNGSGNVFHRKRFSGAVQVFIMDWRDHPGKTGAWYDKRREEAEAMGLMHIFAQEVDRDYNSSVEGVLIPGKWVQAAVDAHIKLGIKQIGDKRAGFDVADEGGDVNALTLIHGVIVTGIHSWGDGDTMESTAKAFRICEHDKTHTMIFDSVGVGAGAKAAARRIETPVTAIPYNGVGVHKPKREYTEGKKNEDMFASGSAQDWWLLRDKFLATYNAVVKGKDADHSSLISIPSNLEGAQQLISELSQVIKTSDARGRVLIAKTPSGTKSPNLADSLKMACSPSTEKKGPSIRVL